MNYTHIVACAANAVIGVDGKLPWHLPEDLKFFKKTTTGGLLIMGRKTYQSIGRPLPNRFTIVISRSHRFEGQFVKTVKNIEEAIVFSQSLAERWGETAFIVGGGEIYRQTLGITDRVILTRLDREVAGDTTYPMEALSQFHQAEISNYDKPETYSIAIYHRQASI